MAIITEEKMQNLDRDIDDAGKSINTKGIIIPRYGEPFKSVPMVVEEIENKGGYISAPSLAALQAITPSYNHQVGRDDSTGNEYRWNPAALPTPQWEPTGRNYLNEAKVDATNKANTAESNAKSYASTQANAAASNIKQSDSVNLHEFTDSEGSVVAAINSNGESVAQDFKGEFGNLNALSKAVETTEAPSLHTFADAGGNVVARLTAAGDFQLQDVVTESGSFNTVAKKVSEYDIQNALSVETDVEGNILEIIRPDGIIVPSITQVSYGIAEFRAGVASPDVMSDVGKAIDNNLVKNDTALKFSVTVSPNKADDTNHQRMADGVLVGPNRLYVAFSQFSTMSTDQSDGRLVGRFVDFDLINQTATISETKPIIGEKIGSLYRHPNFIKLEDRILMIFNGPLPELIVYESFDKCETWQLKNIIDTTGDLPWALALNSAIRIEEGRYKGRIVLGLFRYAADGLVGTVFSDDNGVTWQRGQTLHGADLFPNYPIINETSIALDSQQNLIFVIRNEGKTTESRYLIFAKSTDGGETLKIFEQTTRTPALACQTGLKQICPQFYDGLPRIFATCPTTGDGNREGFRFRVSYDNCMSWAHEYKPFAETLRVGYSTVIPLDQKTYALLYEEGTMNASQSIRLTFLNLAEVI